METEQTRAVSREERCCAFGPQEGDGGSNVVTSAHGKAGCVQPCSGAMRSHGHALDCSPGHMRPEQGKRRRQDGWRSWATAWRRICGGVTDALSPTHCDLGMVLTDSHDSARRKRPAGTCWPHS